MTYKITILGCGNSAGVPAIGNYWGNCDPAEPRNRRTRPGLAVQTEKTTLIVDTGPDFREQMNRENISGLDAVLFTHGHGDHIAGIDDLRVIHHRSKRFVNIYGNRETIAELEMKYGYMFIEQAAIYPKILEPHIIEPTAYGRPMTIGDITFTPFEQDHGTCVSLGYRFGDVAYSTDVVAFSDKALKILEGIKVWIIDAAGYKQAQNVVHLTLKQVYDYNKRVGAEKVYLTHMSPQMDYRTLMNDLTEGFEPAYDGLKITAG